MSRPELLEPLLDLGFRRAETVFAGGKRANNKLELDDTALEQDDWLKETVVEALGAMALEYDPEFIIGVPDGATKLGIRVAKSVSRLTDHVVIPITLRKQITSGQRYFHYQTQQDFNSVLACRRCVIVEDVTNEFTSINKTLNIPGLRTKVNGVLSIFHRGTPEARARLDIPSASVVERYIPPMLEPEDTLWQHAR
jgi:hypothetical protein